MDKIQYEREYARAAEDVQKEMARELDNAIVKGLKLKGFTFKNREDILSFIKSRCSKTSGDVEGLKGSTYYVDGEPFMRFTHIGVNKVSSALSDGTKLEMSFNIEFILFKKL